MNKKKKKIIIISGCVLILILVVFLLINGNKDSKIVKYISNIGFVNYNDSYLYTKQISELNLDEFNESVMLDKNANYEVLYFNINKYQLTKDKMSYDNGITKNFTSVFDYSDNSLNYDYRVNFNETNIIIEGTYDIETDTFVCEPTFSHNIDIENSKRDMCIKIKLEIDNFKYEAKTLIQNPELLEYMEDK